MEQIIFNAQLANARKRVFPSGIVLTALTSLYYIGFREIAEKSVGLTIFNSYAAFHLINALGRLTLSYFKDRLKPLTFLRLYYLLISLGGFGWACSGVFLYWLSTHNFNPSPELHDLIKIQFFMIVGILNTIPQFFRHAKTPFLWNSVALYIGLFFLVSVYFNSRQPSIFASLLVLLYAIVVTPQYLANWKGETQHIEHEKELQDIIDGFPGAFSEIENGLYKRVNQYVKQKMFGTRVLDTDWFAKPIGFLNEDSEWIKAVKNFEQSSKSHEVFQHKLPTIDGERYFVTTLTKIHNSNILIASIDVHELVLAQQELEAQKIEAERKARLANLGLMASGIAHEINNPLAVIQSRADMIGRRLSKLDSTEAQEALKSLDRIFPMIKRITQIINSMRSLARDSSHDDFEQITVQMILDDIKILVEEKLKSLQIELSYSGDALNEPFYGLKGELAQVFVNAINNSIHAIQNLDQRWIRIQVSTQDGSYLKIEVQDSGLGIPEMYRDKIMTPLFTTKSPGEGTGLGLALCRKIIEVHKGDIYFDHSKPNTTLVIELPIKQQMISQSA
jgi:signal transduction histidine kinase